jgi:4-amino-4-deoxy-L-arabinose transferase-like glycosyltransferase
MEQQAVLGERKAGPMYSAGRTAGATDAGGRIIRHDGPSVRGRRRDVKGELAPGRAASSGGRTRALAPPWHRLALAAVLILSTLLNLLWLPSEGYANTYYAATVKNMLTSWSNFFFVSFDAGFVSVDKPPLGLWIQAANAWLFGFSGPSLLLPQAIAGVLPVAVLYHLVRRSFGPVAGLLAAVALAVTPISVAVQRNNVMDALLILVLLLATWTFVVAAERGSLRWLLLGAAVVGLGFNIKMLQAFLVLPAFYLLYLLAARVSWRRRLLHLGAATLVLAVVSLSWAVAVDLTPAGERPYVGSSPDDSVLGLILGYNGFDRLLGVSSGSSGENIPAGAPGGPGGGTMELGDPGPLRLLNGRLAGQASWLLPLAVVGLLAAIWQGRPRLPLDREHAGLVLWGVWLLTTAAYFSVAAGGHRYYTVMLAPAVAALAGIGVAALWKYYRSSDRRWWLLPLVLVGVAGVQAYVLLDYPIWRAWLIPPILALNLGAAVFLIVSRLKGRLPGKRTPYPAIAAGVGMLALLFAPTAWAAHDVLSSQGGGMGLPSAGPRSAQAFGPPPGGPPGGGQAKGGGLGGPPGSGTPGGGPGGGPGGPGGPGGRNADPALVEYLQANRGDAGYLVAVSSATSASPIILNTDEPVISLGGYNGVDPVFTPDGLADLVYGGAVRFFLMPDREAIEDMRAQREADGDGPGPRGGPVPGGGPGSGVPQNGSADWIEENCEKVPQELWQSDPEGERGGPPMARAQALFDCGTGGA